MKKKHTLLTIIIAITLFLAIGCKPQQKPDIGQQQQNQVQIPEQIEQGERQEPRLTVYIVETEEMKEMAFEEYIEGVLAGEMNNDWPIEALEAQAILARTFVIEFIDDKGGSKYEGAHVSTDIEEAQAWKAEEINERIKQAVQNTRGKVALHENEYIKAWFHAHAGGQTATAKEGLGFDAEEPPYIQVVESPDSDEAPEEDVNWTASFTKQEIIEAVAASGQNIEDFTNIGVVEKGPSNRATKLQVGEVIVAAPAFRLALDSTRMKSTNIQEITVGENEVIMKGIGYGHGVGMSQWGAYQMAQEGKSPEEILKYYFKGIKIEKLWD